MALPNQTLSREQALKRISGCSAIAKLECVDYGSVIFGSGLYKWIQRRRAATGYMFQIPGHQCESMHSGGCDKAGIINMLVASGEKLAPKLRNLARDRLDPISVSVHGMADPLLDLISHALFGPELGDPLQTSRTVRALIAKVRVVHSLEPGSYIRFRLGLPISRTALVSRSASGKA